MNFWKWELICVALQFILFLPFYLEWKKQCKEIGKERLAVSLDERFFTWVVYFPIWIIPIMALED